MEEIICILMTELTVSNCITKINKALPFYINNSNKSARRLLIFIFLLFMLTLIAVDITKNLF